MKAVQRLRMLAMAGACLLPWSAQAITPGELLATWEKSARQANSRFDGYSAERGQRFFTEKHSEWSCSTCHTATPTAAGTHFRTQKSIAPLAPAANPRRFTDPAKVDKWFTRNCNDVLGRACTPQEQGDVLAWLVTLK